MTRLFTIYFTFVAVLTTFVTLSSSLECYYCRTNVCSHQYCNEANSLMQDSEQGLSPEAWKKIPPCPDDDKKQTIKDEEEYVQKCPKKVTACGRFIFNITSTGSKQILPAGNNSVVPVLGGGAQTFKSSVIAYGCVLPKYKSCSTGYSKDFKVPSVRELSSGQVEVTDVIVTNTEAACCHCEQDRCNEFDGTLTCDQNAPQSDPAGGTGNTGVINQFQITTFLILAIGYLSTVL